MRKLALIPAFLILLLITACSPNENADLNLISASTIPSATEEAPDAIVTTPGGPCYRANFHQAGVENPWPSIESTSVLLDSKDPAYYVSYRDYIETSTGETRNNILRLATSSWDTSLKLYTDDMPTGIEIVKNEQWHSPGAIAAILSISIAADVEPGEYTFDISADINGESYGSVPCTINVIS
jgi:hypothetical protein